MGQIIIDVPQRGVKRRYKLDDAKSAEELLTALQEKAQRIKVNPEKLSAEDLADVRAAKRARQEKGFLTVEQLKAELNL
ncbi:MAG: hypothetical protein M3525_12720 [Acidobacteriota bacterium]|nr:hypothetical protein [Acidobacteriota bacterium]